MDDEGGPSWFAHPVYSRYWQHYQQAMAWYQRHQHAYRKAVETFYGSCGSSSRYCDWSGEETSNRPQRRTRVSPESANTTSDSETEESSQSEFEYDVSNTEITEELRQYFAQTERHRQELKQQQLLEAEQKGPYVPADRELHMASWVSAQPPMERPGERRAVEMKKLYGEEAAKIMGMETAMQLSFDRNCDRKQPKYWPVIPLKL